MPIARIAVDGDGDMAIHLTTVRESMTACDVGVGEAGRKEVVELAEFGCMPVSTQ